MLLAPMVTTFVRPGKGDMIVIKKILIATKLHPVAREVLQAHGAYEVVQEEETDLAGLASLHPDTYALIVRSEQVTQEVIDLFAELRVIVRAGAGFNTIDTRYARKKGIDVMNTPGANANAVAEEVVAMMLADARHVIPAHLSTREGKWEKKAFMGREVAHKTIGIVGLGNIGQLVARRLAGFEVRLLGYDPAISLERAKALNIEIATMEEIFEESDYITLHIPENDETRGIVTTGLLSRLKDGATIVNCARAGIIDEAALRKIKDEKNIHFLNDVYAKDEAGPKSVRDIADIMLPHLGASTLEANLNAARRAAEQIIDLDEKGITSFIVNRDIPEGLDETYCELAYTLARLARCIGGNDTTLSRIETSFYGSLKPYADWLLVPVVAGVWEDFDRSMDYKEARTHLDEMGIGYLDRETDESKQFENSITVDLICKVDADNLRHVSIRGTVAENIMMVSRINEFNKLYFEPVGETVFFLYDDRPGILGLIGKHMAEAGVNIEDVRNPHDRKTNRSLAIMRINRAPSPELMRQVSQEIRALAAFRMRF
jgi:D-3-phosphoglycerate dehydrogenase